MTFSPPKNRLRRQPGAAGAPESPNHFINTLRHYQRIDHTTRVRRFTPIPPIIRTIRDGQPEIAELGNGKPE